MILESERELEIYLSSEMQDDYFSCVVTNLNYRKQFTQLKLGIYGIADIVRVCRCDDSGVIEIQLMELKKCALNKDAISQICRYKRGIDEYMREYHSDLDYEISGVLLGSSLASMDLKFMIDEIPWLSAYTYQLHMSCGIRFFEIPAIMNYEEPSNFTEELSGTVRELQKIELSNEGVKT